MTGDIIKELRRAHQPPITQQELAHAIGVAMSTVFKWEQGDNDPDSESVSKLAKFFRQPERIFMRGSGAVVETQITEAILALEILRDTPQWPGVLERLRSAVMSANEQQRKRLRRGTRNRPTPPRPDNPGDSR
jgi:transcriptional regulator with XRE-family HTH domain